MSAMVTQVRRLRTSLTQLDADHWLRRPRTGRRSRSSPRARPPRAVRRSAPSLVTRIPARTSRALSAAGSRLADQEPLAVVLLHDAVEQSRGPASTSGVCTSTRPVGRRSSSSSSCRTSRPPVQDADAGAQLLDLAEQVAGEEHRGPGPVEVEQQLADLLDALRVEAVGRLVEHQQPGLAQQRAGQAEPLPHAERVRADRPLVHAASPTRSSASATRPRARAPVAVRRHRVEEREVAPSRQVRVRRRPLDQRADLRQHPPRGPRHLLAEQLDPSRGGQDQAEQHPDRRRLAGAVGAEEAVDVALADVEVDLVHGRDRPEPLGQPLGADHRRRGRSSVVHVDEPGQHVVGRPRPAPPGSASRPAASRRRPPLAGQHHAERPDGDHRPLAVLVDAAAWSRAGRAARRPRGRAAGWR